MIRSPIWQFAIALLILLPSFANGQDAKPLSVEATSVEVETATQSLKRIKVIFESNELNSSEVVVAESSSLQKAVLITVSEPARNVAAFNTEFESATIVKVDDSRYLLSGKPGKYLVVVDTINSGSTIRPVVLESSKPPEPPAPDLSELAKLSADLARQLNDPPTQSALAAELSKVNLAGLDLEAAKRQVNTTIEQKVLLKRTGESRYKDWLNGWRRPMQQAIDAIPNLTFEAYQDAIKQIAESLQDGQVSTSNGRSRVLALGTRTIKPISGMFRPVWTQPPGPHFIGQVHDGRRLDRVCNGNSCSLVWNRILAK